MSGLQIPSGLPLGRSVEGVLALLFPGQGAHTDDDRGQVERFAPELLDRATLLIGEDPFARVDDSTRFAQPALFCTSLARSRAAELPEAPAAFAGHSLGEFGALVAAGALSAEDGLRLVVERGRLMAEAQPGAMVALRGSIEQAWRLANEHGWVVANDNAPGQVVLSGDAGQVQAIVAAARGRGLRAMALPVTGAFHSPLMAAAAEHFALVLADVDFRPPIAPVYCCATAAPFEHPATQLAEALTAPVRWRELLVALRDAGTTSFVDIGPGQVIDGLVRRTLPEAERIEVELHEPTSRASGRFTSTQQERSADALA